MKDPQKLKTSTGPLIFILVALTGSFFETYSQEYEMVANTGHDHRYSQNPAVQRLKFSPDGLRIVTGGQDGKVILWDLRSGRKLREFNAAVNNVRAVDFIDGGKKLITFPEFSGGNVWDVSTGKLEKFIDVPEKWDWENAVYDEKRDVFLVAQTCWYEFDPKTSKQLRRVGTVATNDGFLRAEFCLSKGVAAACHADGRVTVWSYPQLKQIKSLKKNTDWNGELAFSPSGKYLAVADKILRVYDVAQNFKLIREVPLYADRNGPYDYHAGQVAFSPDDRSIVVSGVFENTSFPTMPDYAILKYDLSENKIVHEFNNVRIRPSGMDISPDGNMLAIGTDSSTGSISIFDMTSGNLLRTIDALLSIGVSLQVDSKGEKLIFSTASDVHVFDISTGEKIKTPKPEPGGYNYFSFTEGEDLVLHHSSTNGSNTKTFRAKIGEGKFKLISSEDMSLLSTMSTGSEIARFLQLQPVDIFNSEHKLVRSVPWHTFGNSMMFGRPYNVSQSGRYATIVGYTSDKRKDKALSIIDLKENVKVKQIKVGDFSLNDISGVTDNLTYAYDGYQVWNVATEQVQSQLKNAAPWTELCLFLHDNKTLVTSKNNDVRFWNAATGDEIISLKSNPGKVQAMDVTPDDKFLFTLSLEGIVNKWDVSTGEKLGTFFAVDNENYAVVWKDGYYRTSPQASKYIHFVKELEAYGFENFDLVYNRPDLISKYSGVKDDQLINAYYKAYKKRLNKMGFDESQISKKINLPIVTLLQQKFPVSTTDASLNVQIQIKDEQQAIDRINIYVNNVPIYGMKGLPVTQGTRELTQTLDIPLSSGKNKIEISAHNKAGYESPRQVVDIVRENVAKPDLYVVAIGVSDYKNNDFDLTYAAKDAGDLVQLLGLQTNFYGNVIPFLISDKNATRENILKIKSELKNSKIDDEVIVFAAGHGLVDENFDYYFATHDVDFNKPSVRGLKYEELEDLVDGIPARKKLMLIDACHSGEIDKDESQLVASAAVDKSVKSRGFKKLSKKSIGLDNSFDLMQQLFADLRRGTGAVVISSASGVEFAYESAQWQNGVFTFSVLEAFRNPELADQNKNKSLEVSELKDYVTKRVTELTDGKQNPTSRRENLEFDFVVK